MHKKALSWYFTINLPYFHIFSVNSQNNFSQLIFVYNKYLVLIQTCFRTIVDLKKNPFGINNSELCEHITCFFG